MACRRYQKIAIEREREGVGARRDETFSITSHVKTEFLLPWETQVLFQCFCFGYSVVLFCFLLNSVRIHFQVVTRLFLINWIFMVEYTNAVTNSLPYIFHQLYSAYERDLAEFWSYLFYLAVVSVEWKKLVLCTTNVIKKIYQYYCQVRCLIIIEQREERKKRHLGISVFRMNWTEAMTIITPRQTT